VTVCCRSLWSPKGSQWYRLFHEEVEDGGDEGRDGEEGGDEGRDGGSEGERGIKSELAKYEDERGIDSIFD